MTEDASTTIQWVITHNWYIWWAAISTALITPVGFIIVGVQLFRTRKAAVAAEKAAIKAEKQLQKRIALADLSKCCHTIENLSRSIRNDETTFAMHLASELIANLIDLRGLAEFETQGSQADISARLSQVTIIQNNLERNLHEPDYEFDKMRAAKKLNEIRQYFLKRESKSKYS